MTNANNNGKQNKKGMKSMKALTITELVKQRKTIVKHQGPKKPSFNLSATKSVFGFTHPMTGALTILNDKTLQHLFVSDDMNQTKFNPKVRLFMVTEGSTKVEDFMVNEKTLVQRNSESMLVRDAAKVTTEFNIVKKDPLNRKQMLTEKLEAFDNTRQLNLKVADVVVKLKKLFESKEVKARFGNIDAKDINHFIKEVLLNGVVNLDFVNGDYDVKVFTLNSAAPSQTRKGEAAFWQYAEQRGLANLKDLIFDDAKRSIAVYGRFVSTYRMNEYGKLNLKRGKRIFKMDKEPKRLDMPASGSRDSQAFKFLFGKMVIVDRFLYTDDEKEAGTNIKVVKEAIVLESSSLMMGGVKRRILIIQDPIREVEATAKVVEKYNTESGKPEIVEGLYKFPKNLVDGGILVSEEVTEFMVAEGNLKHKGQSFQGRGVAGVKPFAYGTPMLKEMTGVDMVFMSGALKLDVIPSLLEGRFEFAVVQGSRLEFAEDMAPVATQALLAAGTPQENLELLHMIAAGRIDASMYSASKALKILGITENFDEETMKVVEQDEEFMEEMDGETGVKAILRKAPHAIKDGLLKDRLINIMAKALEKIKLGNVLVDDAKMRHMGFDIFMVVKAIESLFVQRNKGVEVPQMEWVNSIPAGGAVVVDAYGRLRAGYFLAIRYPALKNEEVRKVLAAVEFGSEEARLYYERAAQMGFFQGLVLFNSVDMTTEAMSGADFDGDTCLVIFNALMVEPFVNKTPLLDFFITESGALEGGCPWSAPEEAVDFKAHITAPEGLEFTQVMKDNSRTWALEFNEEDVVNRPADVYYVFNRAGALHIAETAKISSIGTWTNRLMNVEDIQLEIVGEIELARQLQDRAKFISLSNELAFYDDMAMWLTCIVRWAIDEAKHGGAFNGPLAHIVNIFEDATSPTKMREDLEKHVFKMGRMF